MPTQKKDSMPRMSGVKNFQKGIASEQDSDFLL